MVSHTFFCVIHDEGQVWCQRVEEPFAPELRSDLENVVKLRGSNDNFCALLASGEVRCAYLDEEDTFQSRFTDAIDIAVNSGTACALLKDRRVDCFGEGGGIKAEMLDWLKGSLSWSNAPSLYIEAGVSLMPDDDESDGIEIVGLP